MGLTSTLKPQFAKRFPIWMAKIVASISNFWIVTLILHLSFTNRHLYKSLIIAACCCGVVLLGCICFSSSKLEALSFSVSEDNSAESFNENDRHTTSPAIPIIKMRSAHIFNDFDFQLTSISKPNALLGTRNFAKYLDTFDDSPQTPTKTISVNPTSNQPQTGMDFKNDETEAKSIRGIWIVVICLWVTAAALVIFAFFWNRIAEMNTSFDIWKMCVIFKSFWVRKLIGKLGVPYNRRVPVRGSLHPLYYEGVLPPPAVESNVFRRSNCPGINSNYFTVSVSTNHAAFSRPS